MNEDYPNSWCSPDFNEMGLLRGLVCAGWTISIDKNGVAVTHGSIWNASALVPTVKDAYIYACSLDPRLTPLPPKKVALKDMSFGACFKDPVGRVRVVISENLHNSRYVLDIESGIRGEKLGCTYYEVVTPPPADQWKPKS